MKHTAGQFIWTASSDIVRKRGNNLKKLIHTRHPLHLFKRMNGPSGKGHQNTDGIFEQGDV